MDVAASIIVILILVGLFLYIRRRPRPENIRPDVRRESTATSNKKFHAVSINYSVNACAAAKNMQGRRFLSGAAPRIPLPECDAAECKCKFVHHQDRRGGDDRRNPWGHGIGSSFTGNYRKEKRKGRDRRNS